MMRREWATAGTAVALTLLCTSTALADEHFEDAVGDALGDAPDVVAVTVSEPEGPVLSFRVTFASEPPLAADGTRTDLLWLALDTDPEVAFPELDGYSMMSMGRTRAVELETGGYLLAGDDLYAHVVDIALDGGAITFSVDRKLLGDPAELDFRVYSAALEGSLYTEETDHYPDEGEPPAHYALSREWD
jgi:hypothetical protein